MGVLLSKDKLFDPWEFWSRPHQGFIADAKSEIGAIAGEKLLEADARVGPIYP